VSAAKKTRARSAAKPVYRAVAGSRFTADDAAVIGPEIEKLTGGKATTPAAVLDAARKKASPLHKFFDWDDSSAAQKYRLDQARYMLRSIEIEWVDMGPKPIHTRAFHVVRDGDGQKAYAAIGVIRTDNELLEQVVARAKAEAASWYQRYNKLRHVAEIGPILGAIEASGIVVPADAAATAAE
jgi:hypothetical protein